MIFIFDIENVTLWVDLTPKQFYLKYPIGNMPVKSQNEDNRSTCKDVFRKYSLLA